MEAKLQRHTNSFNLLRVIFAIFVLVTHSFVLSGNTSEEPLGILTGNINLSYIGLRGFFTISGFLILQSFERSKSAIEFLIKRILRIFPALISISFLIVFIVCPIISTNSLIEYFSDHKIYLTFLEFIDPLFLVNNHPSVLGVFKKNNINDQLNGSLWTISYEFLFYISFIPLFIKRNRNILFVLYSFLIVGLFFIKFKYLDPWFKYEIYIRNTKFLVKALFDFFTFFCIGAFCAIIQYDKMKQKFHKISIVVLSTLILILLSFKMFDNFNLFLFAPLFVSIGLLHIGKWDITQKIGDISYGIYLSSFFIQQLLMNYYHFSPYSLLIFSLFLSIIYGFLSWKLIEKPFLAYKKVI